ncbi:MAG: flavodoxin domain-containing protein [Candidatus Aminicenantes bacterium]|nr:flavodoxin domain-containing protein [Candidatus Aminicenantes bacterium]
MGDKVLVAYGSKHGMTAEIAERIGKVLRQAGHEVDVRPAGKAGDPSAYRAVVLGSGVYAGFWRREAAKFLKVHEAELAGRPVWLFSSGPTGAGDMEKILSGWKFPKGLQPFADRIKPRGVVVFRGAFDEAKASFFERWIMKKVKAPSGDFRDWPAIESWAGDIARVLQEGRPASS